MQTGIFYVLYRFLLHEHQEISGCKVDIFQNGVYSEEIFLDYIIPESLNYSETEKLWCSKHKNKTHESRLF